MRAGIGTGGMNPNVIPVQDMRIAGLPAAAPMQAAPMPAQAAPQRQGLLGGFFGPQGRDARARLAIGLERDGGKAGDEHDLGRGADLGAALREFDSIHFRHDNV